MKVFSVLIIALFLLLVPSYSAKAQETKNFISKEGEFSIDFPDKPEIAEKQLNSIIKGKVYNYNVDKNDISFSLIYTDCEPIDPKITANKEIFVYSIATGFLKSTNGELLAAIKTKYNDFIGRSLKIRVNDKVMFSRIYYVNDKKDKIYQVLVTVNKKEVLANEQAILRFLSSFKLLDSKGIVINNKENDLLFSTDPSSPKPINTAINNTGNSSPSTSAIPPSLEPNILSAGNEGVKQPQILQKTKPKYTNEARENSVEGTVILSAVFRKDGTITDVKLVNALGYGLDEEAIKAASLIKFIPGQKDDKPVSVRARLEFYFTLF